MQEGPRGGWSKVKALWPCSKIPWRSVPGCSGGLRCSGL